MNPREESLLNGMTDALNDVGELRRSRRSLASDLIERLRKRGFMLIEAPVCNECGDNIRTDWGVTVFMREEKPYHGVCWDKVAS